MVKQLRRQRSFFCGLLPNYKQNELRGPYSASELTDRASATCRRNLVPTSVDIVVSRGQRGGSPTVVNLSFLDRSR
jgi:hypothetical protein